MSLARDGTSVRGFKRWQVPLWVLAAAAVGTLALFVNRLGPLSAHMSVHIVLMNLAAPALALKLAEYRRLEGGLWGSGLTQFVVLLAAHTPQVLLVAHNNAAALVLMHSTLFCIAVWFWMCCLGQPGRESWRSILALALTGKLVCLIAALLVLAPRALYPDAFYAGSVCISTASRLDDQHLAGVLMLAACPLSYVVGGIVFAARWMRALEQPPLGDS